MRDPYSIADCVESVFRDNPNYLLTALKDLYDSTTDEEFRERMERICKDSELCTDCFSDLIINKEEDLIGEYAGTPAKEIIYKRTCGRCGKVVE